MLVLSRKQREAIIVGDGEIVIRVVEVRGDKVRIGIEAPADIPVHREEIWQQIQQKASADANRVATPEGESGRQVANTHEA